jgi:hypothetical protein
MLSWAIFMLGFGPCVERRTGEEGRYVAWHNSSYKRAALLSYGDRLDQLFEVEGFLHRELRERGHRLWMEPAAKVLHLNTSALANWISELFNAGRVFGGRRARSWSTGRRLLYLFGSPLIPLRRLPGVLSQIYQSGLAQRLLPRILPSVCLGLILHTVGEMVGYACGIGSAARKYSRNEFCRLQALSRHDKCEWALS